MIYFMRERIRLFFCVLLLFCGFSVSGKAGETLKVDCWMEVSSASKTLNVGDSCLVSYQLFSDLPFNKVIYPSEKDLKVKHGTMHLVRRGNDGATFRVRRGNKIYYSAVVAQYMVAVDREGKCKLPDLTFQISFYYALPAEDFFSQFMGRQKVQTFTKNLKAKDFFLDVTQKPRRSTTEMMKSGTIV